MIDQKELSRVRESNQQSLPSRNSLSYNNDRAISNFVSLAERYIAIIHIS